MKKISLLLLVFLFGCNHAQIRSWKGAPKAELVGAFGEPTSVVSAGWFHDAYIYKTPTCVSSYTINFWNNVSEVRQSGQCEEANSRSPAKK